MISLIITLHYLHYLSQLIFLLLPQVTLLHVESHKDLMSVHTFRVDSSVKNVTLHVSGTMTECILTSPSGNSHIILTSAMKSGLVFFPSRHCTLNCTLHLLEISCTGCNFPVIKLNFSIFSFKWQYNYIYM